jgi:hypothetical protein
MQRTLKTQQIQIIQYKVLCLTHKSLKTGHPSYLRSLLSSKPPRFMSTRDDVTHDVIKM